MIRNRSKNISKYLFLVRDNILLDTWTSLSTSLLVHYKAFTVMWTCRLILISNIAFFQRDSLHMHHPNWVSWYYCINGPVKTEYIQRTFLSINWLDVINMFLILDVLWSLLIINTKNKIIIRYIQWINSSLSGVSTYVSTIIAFFIINL
mgnify:CR=1 FL=1